MQPSIGRVVVYRSRTGNYSIPALINATTETLFRPNVEAGYLDDLSSDTHVHLTCLTPGRPNARKDAPDFVVRPEVPAAPNVGGLYQEWDIPQWEAPGDSWAYDEQPAGTWAWPPRR